MYLETFVVLFGVCGVSTYLTWDRNEGRSLEKEAIVGSDNPEKTNHRLGSYGNYVKFRNNYLVVFLCMMCILSLILTFVYTWFVLVVADWLQGSYVYALYKSYNFDLGQIGQLFIVGFLSSAVLGTVISSFADKS